MPVVRIEEPARPTGAQGFALLNLGFRPFYLLAALFGAVAVVAWVAQLEGRLAGPALQAGVAWHAHEMVFGFALAVIAGFLLTAVRAWTGIATPSGIPLAALALLWIAARVAMWTGPAPVALALDGAFPFVLAAVLGRVLVRAGNRRNYFVIALLCALGALNVAFHAGYGLAAAKAALYLVLVLVMVMGGRVIPPFTGNALPKARVTRRPRVDVAAIAVSLAAFAADAAGAPAAAVAPLALAAGALHLVRQSGWAPLATRGTPILWILHLSYAWIPAGFFLMTAGTLGMAPAGAATHAFAAGAMGGLIIGMITRTALGHTGNPLVAGRAETVAYVLVHVAAAIRVIAALVPGPYYLEMLGASGLAWAGAFLLYAAAYAPRLLRPRPDGKPG